jgi:hypothetical protein
MQTVKKYIEWMNEKKEGLNFLCPGCNEIHSVSTLPNGWAFNGDFEKPTLSPSILVRSGHYAKDAEPGNCWCDFSERTGQTSDFKCFRCHSFVTDGRIQFLSDCTHELAGQTVDFPPWPYS